MRSRAPSCRCPDSLPTRVANAPSRPIATSTVSAVWAYGTHPRPGRTPRAALNSRRIDSLPKRRLGPMWGRRRAPARMSTTRPASRGTDVAMASNTPSPSSVQRASFARRNRVPLRRRSSRGGRGVETTFPPPRTSRTTTSPFKGTNRWPCPGGAGAEAPRRGGRITFTAKPGSETTVTAGSPGSGAASKRSRGVRAAAASRSAPT